MIPSKLSMENFFSHKNSELDFSEFNSALLIGNTEGDYTKSNGSGKSAIFESILWCLFNKSRVAMMDDVIRWGENNCKVTLDFLHDGKSYRVIRTRNRMNSTTNVELKVLDSMGSWKDISGSTSGDTNKRIEETIKLDYKTFINSVYFRQNDISEFAESDPSRKKDILKSIVDISRWDEYEKKSKSKAKELNSECKILQVILQDFDKTNDSIRESEESLKVTAGELALLRSKKEDVSKSLNEMRETYQNIKKSLDTDSYDKIMNDIAEIKKEGKDKKIKRDNESLALDKILSEIKNEESKLNNLKSLNLVKKDVPDNIIEDLNSQLTYHKSNMIALKLEIEKITAHISVSNDTMCPTCGSELSADKHMEFVSSQESRLNLIKKDYQNHKIEADSTSSQIDSWNRIINTNLKIEKDLLQKVNIEYKLDILLKEKAKISDTISNLDLSLDNLKNSLKNNLSILDSIKNEDFQKIRDGIKSLEKDLEDIDVSISEKDKMIGRIQERLSNLNIKLNEMSESKKKLDEKIQKIAVLDKLTKYLSKSGIQTVLLDSVIEDLEKTSNGILQSICNEPAIIVLETQRVGSDGTSIVETLDLKVKKDGSIQNFKSLSGGEKFRISLALRVAMSDISSRYGGSCLEFLLLDEVNSPLDRYGVETLFVSVIKSLEDRYKILTITHDEALKEKFDNVINVTKINGESDIEFVTR